MHLFFHSWYRSSRPILGIFSVAAQFNGKSGRLTFDRISVDHEISSGADDIDLVVRRVILCERGPAINSVVGEGSK